MTGLTVRWASLLEPIEPVPRVGIDHRLLLGVTIGVGTMVFALAIRPIVT